MAEPTAIGQCKSSSTCIQEPRQEYSPTRGLRSGLVSLVPHLCDTLGVVGEKRQCLVLLNNNVIAGLRCFALYLKFAFFIDLNYEALIAIMKMLIVESP